MIAFVKQSRFQVHFAALLNITHINMQTKGKLANVDRRKQKRAYIAVTQACISFVTKQIGLFLCGSIINILQHDNESSCFCLFSQEHFSNYVKNNKTECLCLAHYVHKLVTSTLVYPFCNYIRYFAEGLA